jgi:hypothetical protein
MGISLQVTANLIGKMVINQWMGFDTLVSQEALQ